MELFASLWPNKLKNNIADARALQDAGWQYHDWCVLCEKLNTKSRRLRKGDTRALAFQMGRMLPFAEQRKAELRKQVLAKIIDLQSSRRLLPGNLGNESVPVQRLARALAPQSQTSRRLVLARPAPASKGKRHSLKGSK
jgi:hypothetical protein